MSTENIVGNEPSADGGCVLAFATKRGDVLYYKYDEDDASAIKVGSDPRWLDGVRTSGLLHLSPTTLIRLASAAAEFAEKAAAVATDAAATVVTTATVL